MLTYSAPAKVILSGEHVVVYGKPALASAVDLCLYVQVWKKGAKHTKPPVFETRKVLHHNITAAIPKEAVAYVVETIKKYLEKQSLTWEDRPFEYDVFTEIPLGSGLGSSAALSVAAVGCLLEWFTGKEFEKEIINNLAYKVEKYFHGTPSGIDNSVSCFGGLVYYRKEFEFLKHLSSLNFKLPRSVEEKLYLIDTGKPVESTMEMVQGVARKYNRSPASMERTMDAVEKVTKRMVVSIVKENAALFAACVKENQRYLEKMGVVSKSASDLLQGLEPYGVGKVTGAGGKKQGAGFLLFYADDPQGLEEYLQKEEVSFFKFVQDGRGVGRGK